MNDAHPIPEFLRAEARQARKGIERPILFSAPMVLALLDGTKTQTRRICKPAEAANLSYVVGPFEDVDRVLHLFGDEEGFVQFHCPYGQPGDSLWVRETGRAEELDSGLDGVRYLADDAFCPIENTPAASEEAWGVLYSYHGKRGATVPPIHMPRWASRILLEIVSVRVERLNDISEADAKAEGCKVPSIIYPDEPRSSYSYAEQYRLLWDSINGPGSWDANPWVWCIEFKRAIP